MFVTTSKNVSTETIEIAKKIACQLGWNYQSREKSHFETTTLVIERNQPVLYSREKTEKFFFHPSMAKSRIHQLNLGQPDALVQAMCLKQGDYVLDCTLGLASDAIVSAYVIGAKGGIVGLESVPIIAFMVHHGLSLYSRQHKENWKEIFSRVRVHNTNYKNYLKQQTNNQFDVVYFDPMFSTHIDASDSMVPLKVWANHEQPDQNDIAQACRVARRRVVMKSFTYDAILEKLGFQRIPSKMKVCYGYIDVKGNY